MIYVVKRGDSLYSIARKFNVPLERVIELNRLTTPEKLVVGQTIFIPKENILHSVIQGESLFLIARKYGVPLNSLLNTNPSLLPPYTIYPGQEIIVPLKPSVLGDMEVNGFVLPNISDTTLNLILPNLTYLSIFSYQVMANGNLSSISDENLINKSIQSGVAPLMVITNIENEGGFSGEITNAIFNNEEVENLLITNIVNTLTANDYYGVVVDFEYIFPRDKDNHTEFLTKVTARLHPLGYLVFSALAPKTSADQKGTLYEAHDYKAIGKIVDRVIIMTYEWGYLLGPPLAVSPVNSVKEVLDYAVTAIPPNKILMGVPNYAYDWTLPFVEGTAARILSNVEAVNQARNVGAFIEYDPKSQAPFYTYYKDNKRHIVWFDDARSIDAKLRLVDEYGLAGVSYWALNVYFPQNWLVQNSLYNTIKVIE